jgi:RimJ/RimL family protein N-acetyltransferase
MTCDRVPTWHAVQTVLAADLACAVEDFDRAGVVVVAAADRPGRRALPFHRSALRMVATGRGVVVSCPPEHVRRVRGLLETLPRDHIIAANTLARLAAVVAADGQELHGPYSNYLCWPARFQPAGPPDGITIQVLQGPQVSHLYQYPGFDHALAYQTGGQRPDVLAAAAYFAGEVIGVAGASADGDVLWQVGADVHAASQGRGIGRAVVSRVTEAIFAAGRVPHYVHAVANLPSARVALSLGYRPAWVEVYTRAVQHRAAEQDEAVR